MTQQTVGSYFGHSYNYPSIEKHPLVLGNHLVGIEIELENISGVFENRYWEQKRDDSLRNNGAEFVCRGAWGGRDLHNAVVAMDSYLSSQAPDASWRCSTHVHLDVRDLTVKQLKNLILLYTIFEKLLFQMSGMSRYKNNFCPAFGFAQSQIQTLSRFWHVENDRFLNRISNNWVKYSSMNLLPLSRFGSVEFRIAEPTYKKGNLLRLCNRYLALKEKAVEWGDGSYEELINWASAADPHELFKRGLPRKVDNYGDCLETGVKLAWDILSMGEVPAPAGNPFTIPEPAPTVAMELSIEPNGPISDDTFQFHDPRGAWSAIVSLLRSRHSWVASAEARNARPPFVLHFRYIQPICDALSIDDGYFFGDEGRRRYSAWVDAQAQAQQFEVFVDEAEFLDEDEDLDFEDDDDSEW